MTKTINIERQAFGSKTDNIGDTTLYYSANCSSHTLDVKGQFLDNPPMLSLHHASLVWRYNVDVDKYLLIHVQGSHVVNSAKGRQYTFRAGYEVSRDDMNAIDFRLAPLFKAMPKMSNMPSGRVESQTKVDINSGNDAIGSNSLASHLLKAVIDGLPLYISIDDNGEGLKNDGIFDSLELKTLLATIDSLPVDKRRYVTFGFCVDDHYASVLENVPVIIYLKDSQITIPQEACCLSWKEATSTKASPVIMGMEKEWLGAKEPLLTQEQLSVMRKTAVNGADILMDKEWETWLSLGHQLSELEVDSWTKFSKLYGQMDDKTRADFIVHIKDKSLSWMLDDFSEELYKTMAYSKEQILALQKETLRDYLLNSTDFKFCFLFPKGVTQNLTIWMADEKFLNTLNIRNQEDTFKWYNIYQQHKALSEKPISTFIALYRQYAEGTLQEVMVILDLVLHKKSHYLQEEYLSMIKSKELLSLLQEQPSELIKNSEQLLIFANQLPKKWKDFVKKLLLPTIREALKDKFVGPLSERRIVELIDSESYYWELATTHPHISEMVEDELTAARQHQHNKILSKGNKENKQFKAVSKWTSSKIFWSLVGWLIGLLMGIGACLTFALSYGQVKF